MWRLNSATLRERITSNQAVRRSFANSFSSSSKRSQHVVSLQLDYYLSPQFAGVASALVNNTYSSKGIDISFLPICPVGTEQAHVRKHQNANPSGVTLGTVEQNIFIPNLAADPSLKTTAVAAMFGQSPLCIASLKDPTLCDGDGDGLKIGTHEDTVEIMQRIFPEHTVVASPRASKNTDLVNGTVGAIQAYTTTEVPALRRQLGDEPFVTPMEGHNRAKLGYSQVIFAPQECLQDSTQKLAVQKFLEATFEGYNNAVRDPNDAVRMVNEAKKMLNLNDENNDHWYPSAEFDVEMLAKCNDYVKRTFQGDRYGVIDAKRWNNANAWLLEGASAPATAPAPATGDFGLDATVWQPPPNLLAGNELSRNMMEEARASALSFKDKHGRKPSLAVITVGELERYQHGDRRLQIYSNPASSWFSKTSTGDANGFDVTEIHLDGSSTTTEELLDKIHHVRDDLDVDGIQLMWPLPDHIDSAKAFSAIDVERDVDGIHYIGQLEISNKDAYPPATPAATIALMDEYNIDVEGKRVLVIGRSPIVGSPIAHMMREKGGAVTVAHSQISDETLMKLVGDAEIVVCCAGVPGLVKAEWINNKRADDEGTGTVVINVGTTFDPTIDSLVSDVAGDIGKFAAKYSPVPGGIGPISAPALFRNVAKAAWDRMKK